MNRRGWVVTLAGMGLNLALGILYAWSVFSKQLVEAVDKGGFGWTKTQATLPYTIAIGVFGVMMIPAGRLQDKLGPRLVAMTGGLLTAAGLIVASFSSPTSSATRFSRSARSAAATRRTLRPKTMFSATERCGNRA